MELEGEMDELSNQTLGALSYEQLVNRARKGHAEALNHLLERLMADTTYFNMALRIVKHHQDTEDVIQDSLALVFRRWKTYRGRSKFATWYGRIVINCALMKLRANARIKGDNAVPDQFDTDLPPDQRVEAMERSKMLMDAIGKLPDNVAKHAILLHVAEDMTIREVAAELGMPYSSTKSAIQRTRRKLRELLEGKI
jgi:RNA polymerase sigma-70 factor (ECF subfamily)